MEGTDVKYGRDTSYVHDHTYYGNGCPNAWNSSDNVDKGGSPVACSTRLTTTLDDEIQENGTNYNYAAASAGTGPGLTEANAIVPDTFCPLGWQLPYSGTGGDYYDKSKSWRYLNTQYEYATTGDEAHGMRSYPASYVLSGTYVTYIGDLFFLGNMGQYWSNTLHSAGYFYGLNLSPNTINRARDEIVSVAYTLRCVLGISNLIALHGIRVHSLVLWLFIF